MRPRAFLLVPIDPQSKCKSDLTCDCHVDGIDLGILLSDWSIPTGSPGCGGVTPCRSDIDGDGDVDGIDLGILLADWSAGSDFCEPSVCGPQGEMLMGGSSMMSSEAVAASSTPSLEELIQILLELDLDDLAELLQEVYGGQ